MVNYKIAVSIFSTLSILVPITASLVRIKTADLKYRLFLVFLIYGFLTDMLDWYLHGQLSMVSYVFFIVFPLVEAVFYLWLLKALNISATLSKISKWLMWLMPVLWIFSFGSFDMKENNGGIFNASYEILIAFLSGYGILKMTETENDIIRQKDFWLVIGIFIYCFCAFFVSSFLDTEILNKVWFLHNAINVFVYGVFTKAVLTRGE